MFKATLLKTAFALVPRAVMAVKQTTTISANMTAYSTAVGPSSAHSNRSSACNQVRMDDIPFLFLRAPIMCSGNKRAGRLDGPDEGVFFPEGAVVCGVWFVSRGKNPTFAPADILVPCGQRARRQ